MDIVEYASKRMQLDQIIALKFNSIIHLNINKN